MGNLKQAITVFLFLLPLTVSIEKCPNSCQCELDDQGRYYALCDQGKFIFKQFQTEQVITFKFS